MTHSRNDSWQCTGGRNGKAIHSPIEVSSEKCPICDEPHHLQPLKTKKQLPPALRLILMIDFIIIIIGVLAYFIWFRGCPVGQEKVEGKCIAKVLPKPSPIATPNIIINSPNSVISSPLASPTPQPTPSPPNADQTWQKIQQQVKNPDSNPTEIDQALKLAETEFPNDYRFTYERVHLQVNPTEFVEHHQAFAVLKEAARKAIKQGKTEIMLKTLQTDSQQDAKIKKLAIGHQEWQEIIQALEQKDVNLLN